MSTVDNKIMYEIYYMVADGPDDFTWELFHTTEDYHSACDCVKFLEHKGYGVRMFDPHAGKYYNESGKEVI